MTKWTTDSMPAQNGRSVVVTGTGGLGYECARVLARAGADVVLAGRNPAKGDEAVQRIRAADRDARISFEPLDLADLASVAAFGERMRSARTGLDLLINNAGIMIPPKRQETADGFELQLGTNYLGHFALTAQLLPLLRQGRSPRIVPISSVAARSGTIDFDDLNAGRNYDPMSVYSQSKLACLIFAFELQRRSDAGGWGIESIAAHPGIARTDLLYNSTSRWDIGRLVRSTLPFLFQPAAKGALPALYAATSPDAKPGGYYGPDRFSETRGHPAPSRVPPRAEDKAVAARLWQVSEALTGVTFGGMASGIGPGGREFSAP
ncbi:SDR family oxidoreductase (plasmid) [Skermanella sp. TT6]|uniref:SDR family oxidoreductase n=1 Tax=Skermanella cutis TaxID=2775420 RepID=A0ABX7BJQ4_9PROT|nr:SDR family oxidoreductase [Skermanella sp. TT6]QQP93302.1 SDR family oxidoreductase [Skermanella sp. TT6]